MYFLMLIWYGLKMRWKIHVLDLLVKLYRKLIPKLFIPIFALYQTNPEFNVGMQCYPFMALSIMPTLPPTFLLLQFYVWLSSFCVVFTSCYAQ